MTFTCKGYLDGEFPCICFALHIKRVIWKKKALKTPKQLKHTLKRLVLHPKWDKLSELGHIYINLLSALRLISAKEKSHIWVQGSQMKWWKTEINSSTHSQSSVSGVSPTP